MDFFKNTFLVLSSVLLASFLASCQSGGDEMSANVGKRISIAGDLVKAPSGYMIFRNADLASVYLRLTPEGASNPDTAGKFKDFTFKNDGKKVSVTGTLVFKRVDSANKFPEETEKPPTEYYLIYWDAKDTRVDAR